VVFNPVDFCDLSREKLGLIYQNPGLCGVKTTKMGSAFSSLEDPSPLKNKGYLTIEIRPKVNLEVKSTSKWSVLLTCVPLGMVFKKQAPWGQFFGFVIKISKSIYFPPSANRVLPHFGPREESI